jgi:hypothetical protein
MKIRTPFRLRPVHAAVAALLLAAPMAAVQAEPDETEYATPTQQESQDVSDEMLEKYADAVAGVQAVQQEYSAEIQTTEDVGEVETLREEAQKKMVDAVEETGLSVTEYNLISQRLHADPGLAQRFDVLRRFDDPRRR